MFAKHGGPSGLEYGAAIRRGVRVALRIAHATPVRRNCTIVGTGYVPIFLERVDKVHTVSNSCQGCLQTAFCARSVCSLWTPCVLCGHCVRVRVRVRVRLYVCMCVCACVYVVCRHRVQFAVVRFGHMSVL